MKILQLFHRAGEPDRVTLSRASPVPFGNEALQIGELLWDNYFCHIFAPFPGDRSANLGVWLMESGDASTAQRGRFFICRLKTIQSTSCT